MSLDLWNTLETNRPVLPSYVTSIFQQPIKQPKQQLTYVNKFDIWLNERTLMAYVPFIIQLS